jgi:hypothetical protein
MTNRNGGDVPSHIINTFAVHTMLEAMDTIELSKTAVNFMSWGVI